MAAVVQIDRQAAAGQKSYCSAYSVILTIDGYIFIFSYFNLKLTT